MGTGAFRLIPRPADLSFQYKIPLSLAAVTLLAAGVIAVGMVWYAYQSLLDQRIQSVHRLGSVLVRQLAPALRHDELWRAYRTIDLPPGPFVAAEETAGGQRLTILVLRTPERIYVSNRPDRFPPGKAAEGMPGLLAQQLHSRDASHTVRKRGEGGMIYIGRPIIADGGHYGTLVMGFSTASFWPRFQGIVLRIAGLTALVLAILLPVGWLLGRRMARPLSYLSRCLGEVDPFDTHQPHCVIPETRDEIGQLGRRFNELLRELENKAGLEQEIIRNERLAAIGRLSAGIAHEVNNPLGGMRNALSNLRAQGPLPERVERTTDLLERGLAQIQQSVGALLVEVKGAERPLHATDVEDLRTLVVADLQAKHIRISWHNGLPGRVEVPASVVRQIALNLLLNAIQAAEVGGEVAARFGLEEDHLLIQVSNTGPAIPAVVLDRLFEPFVSAKGGQGQGLGLWVTYQLVEQQGGSIRVHSSEEDHATRFRVELPIEGVEQE